MKTATQKIVEEWENEKKKVKEISYYKKILSKKDRKRIEKIYKVLEIIEEEMDLSTDYEKYEAPFCVDIDKNKLLENKILMSDFKKIIDLLRSPVYVAIPKNNEWFSDKKIKEMKDKIIVLFPVNAWCSVIQEECFKYPYEQNFENLNKAIKEILETDKEIEKTTPETESKDSKKKDFKPFCIEEGTKGYFKFYKQGKKIKIGSSKSRHFRLLQSISEPFGVSKTIEAVFEAIRLPKDSEDTKLSDFNTKRSRKVEIIKYTIKELQKNKELQGKLKFKFNDQKTVLQLEP